MLNAPRTDLCELDSCIRLRGGEARLRPRVKDPRFGGASRCRRSLAAWSSSSSGAASVAAPRGLRRSRRSVQNRPRPAGLGCRSSPQPAEVTDEGLCRHIIILTAAAPLPNWRQACSFEVDGWMPMLCASGLIDQNGFVLLFALADRGTDSVRRTAWRTSHQIGAGRCEFA